MSLINKIDRCHCSDNINCIQCNGTWIFVNDRGLRICQECEKVFTWRDEPAGQELMRYLNKKKEGKNVQS